MINCAENRDAARSRAHLAAKAFRSHYCGHLRDECACARAWHTMLAASRISNVRHAVKVRHPPQGCFSVSYIRSEQLLSGEAGRQVLGVFSARREAMHKARSFHLVAGLPAQVRNEEPLCEVAVDRPRPTPSDEWCSSVVSGSRVRPQDGDQLDEDYENYIDVYWDNERGGGKNFLLGGFPIASIASQ